MRTTDTNILNALAWLSSLDGERRERNKEAAPFSEYYDGEHQLAFSSLKFREAFGGRLAEFADNWCGIVVDSVSERLRVDGFRFGSDAAGAKKAWAMWQANNLDADSELGHTEALIGGSAYVIVWAGRDPKTPSITVEDPAQVYVEYAAGSRRTRLAALKVWEDETEEGRVCATVYLPGNVWKFRSTGPLSDLGYGTAFPAGPEYWEPRQDAADPSWPLYNPLGVVPVVELRNAGRIRSEHGTSELKSIVPMQDAVNKLAMDMLIASEFGSFRQRWATGVDIPTDPDTNQAIEPFKVSVDRLWVSESPDAKFGDFPETRLENFVEAIEMLTQHIAAQSKTPWHYIKVSGPMPSGESIKSAETGLVSKVRRKMVHFGEGWEEVIRLAFAVIGDTKRAERTDIETIWADPESRSESEHVDALVKQKAIGVPDVILWEKAGYTPQEIARMQEIIAGTPAAPVAPIVVPVATPEDLVAAVPESE